MRSIKDSVSIFDQSSPWKWIESRTLKSLQFFHLIETFLLNSTNFSILFEELFMQKFSVSSMLFVSFKSTIKGCVLLDFTVHFCTCGQTVYCDRQFFSVAKLLHSFPSLKRVIWSVLKSILTVFLGTIWYIRLSTFHRNAMSQILPNICDLSHNSDSSPKYADVSQQMFARVVDCVFLTCRATNDTSTFHVINPTLVKSPAHTLDSTKLSHFPDAQKPEHWLCVNPFKNTVEHNLHTRWAEIAKTPFYRQFGITEQSLWRSCATCWPLNNHNSPTKCQKDQCKEDFLWHRLCGFALALDRLAISVHSISTHFLQTASLKFPARSRLGPCCSCPIYSSCKRICPTSANCLCAQT